MPHLESELQYETLMSRLCLLVEEAKRLEPELHPSKGLLPFKRQQIQGNLTVVRKEISLLCTRLQKIGASYDSLSKLIKGHV